MTTKNCNTLFSHSLRGATSFIRKANTSTHIRMHYSSNLGGFLEAKTLTEGVQH